MNSEIAAKLNLFAFYGDRNPIKTPYLTDDQIVKNY